MNKLVVVGVGLIGGSFALALKQAKAVGTVVGVGRSEANLRRARELGVIDAAGAFDAATLADANLVMIATPVGEMSAVFRALAPHLGRSTVVTDGGSTKQDVIAAARRELGAALPRFVPGHPVAGTEKSGAGAAFADLYRGRKVILTPLAETQKGAVDLVRAAW
ncbi:MAG TPA: prephenate dehydrogenase/arogenate dehydrogenase family protein [Burkholderiales bacterium]